MKHINQSSHVADRRRLSRNWKLKVLGTALAAGKKPRRSETGETTGKTMGKPWENHREKWENHRKTIGKP